MELTTQEIAKKKKERERRAKKRRVIERSMLILAVGLLVLGGFVLERRLGARETEETRTSYTATAVRSGSVSTVISGSGTLSANHSASFTAPGDDTTVDAVNYVSGDRIPAGSVIMELSCPAVEESIDALEDELSAVLDKLATVSQERSSLKVTAPKAGVVKHILAEAGTVTDDVDYLCLLSTDGKMKVCIDATEDCHRFDTVSVTLSDGTETDGLVTEIRVDGVAAVIIEDDGYPYGDACRVCSASGKLLGEGTLDVNEYVKVTASAARVAEVYAAENTKYSKGKPLFLLAEGALSDTYLAYREQREELEKQIANLKEELCITADRDCVLTSVSVEKGDRVDEGTALCSISGTDGYRLTLSVDELDIASVHHGQEASVTLDAVDGTYRGTVKNISYAGSGSYITNYTVTIVTEPIEGAYPGMSADAEIVVASSGETLIVPVDAVQYDGRGRDRTAYLLAADGAKEGDSRTEEEIDPENAVRIPVTTGMSDGSYIVVEGTGLSDGTLIWRSTLTTSAKYEDDDNSATGGFSGMPAGGMPFGDGFRPDGSNGGSRRDGDRMPAGGGFPGM